MASVPSPGTPVPAWVNQASNWSGFWSANRLNALLPLLQTALAVSSLGKGLVPQTSDVLGR